MIQITELYYRTLMSHSWSRHKVFCKQLPNGKEAYYILKEFTTHRQLTAYRVHYQLYITPNQLTAPLNCLIYADTVGEAKQKCADTWHKSMKIISVEEEV